MTLIEELMTTELFTVQPGESVREVAVQMDKNGVGAVLVMDGKTLRGLFSERDLLRRVISAGLDPDSTSVANVMTSDPVTVAPDAPIKDCARVIRDRGFRHLPVVKDGTPVGILSSRDLQENVLEGLESFISESRYRKALEDGEDPYDHIGGSYAR
jgi:CBS domain-containing protein